MDGGYSRPRIPISGAMGRPVDDGRPGTGPPPPLRSPPQSSPGDMNRAERFQDEKRRIIESCFSKVESSGQLSESYITHIRIQEDEMYPQTPPPPNSQGNKKVRFIIIAVRSTGRVRLHKARENNNKSFSIGKTWNMEEITLVESFSNAAPTTPEQKERKEWAGDLGFLVEIGKPYYWEAGSPKEKEFFVASLIKIYRKYRSGVVPKLVGFSPQEIEHILGPQSRQSQGSEQRTSPSPNRVPSQGQPQPGPTSSGNAVGDQRSHPDSLVPQSGLPLSPRKVSTGRVASGQPSQQSDYSEHSQFRKPPGLPKQRPSQEYGIRPDGSRDQGRPMNESSSIPSMPSRQRLTPQSSQSEIEPQRSTSPATSNTSARGVHPSLPQNPRQNKTQQESHSTFSRQGDQSSMEGSGLAPSTVDRWRPNGKAPGLGRDTSPRGLRPNTAQSNESSSKSDDHQSDRDRHLPSERRRPPYLGPKASGSLRNEGGESTDEYSTPLGSPGLRAPDLQPSFPQSEGGLGDMSTNFKPESSRPSLPQPDQGSLRYKSQRPRNDLPRPSSQSENKGADDVFTSSAASHADQSSKEQEAEVHKPGLGPMIRSKLNKDVANTFRKAANAHGAFQPRAGGARAKLFGTTEPKPDEPNGITGVVPAPGLKRVTSDDSTRSASIDETSKKDGSAAFVSRDVPEVSISKAQSPTETTHIPSETDQLSVGEETSERPALERKASKTPESEAPRPKGRTAQQLKYFTNIGIDPAIMEGRGTEFECILDDLGFGTGGGSEPGKFEELKATIQRELNQLETGNWIAKLEQNDERKEAMIRYIDKTIAELDAFDNVMSLYNAELGTLAEDIAYIEAQSQGLQVQTANQKLLHAELSNLLKNITIDPKSLEPLRRAQLGTLDGLNAIELALLLLYKALLTVEPKLRKLTIKTGKDKDAGEGSENGLDDLSSMRAVKEKKGLYMDESARFLERVKNFLETSFTSALANTQDALNRHSIASPEKLDPGDHDLARSCLWQYSPLVLFAKEIDFELWKRLIKIYCARARGVYQGELRDNALAWKKLAKKPTNEELEVLFTYQEKESEGLSSTARKLTVKRSQTLARSLRSGSTSEKSPRDKTQSGKIPQFEAFAGALDEVLPVIFTEQNFISDFFHATSAEDVDFADVITANGPEDRRGTNLYARKPFEADREMAKLVMEVMDDLFGYWAVELQNLVEWAIMSDPLQGIGILCAIEQKQAEVEDTNQEFITRTLHKLHDRMLGLFNRFVDEQVRAIEDTKVKIKKRKGVIAFIRTFPHFSASVESMLPSEGSEKLNVRATIDDAYQRINKTMFESLKVIAKDNPAVTAGHGVVGQGIGDPEDKEALNYQILLIENMNHYVEEVEDHGDAVLREWKARAVEEMNEHLGLYIGAVIHRPLGKLLDFLESTEALLAASPEPATALSTRSSHARPVFKKLLSAYDAKELRRGVDALKKRVDKHFGDADDPNLSRSLVLKVLKECENKYLQVHDRVKRIADEVYEGSVEPEWKREDVSAFFRR